MSKAIIYIEETNSMADVTFPSVPRVVSLLHYDDIDRNKDLLPVAGYPVICVTVCQKTSNVSFHTLNLFYHCIVFTSKQL